MLTTYFPILVVVGIPGALGLAFLAFMFHARRPIPAVMRTTMSPEDTFYADLDKPNGLFQL